MLRFIGLSTAQAIVGLVAIGLSVEAYTFARLWWDARAH